MKMNQQMLDLEVTQSNVLPSNPLDYDIILVTDRESYSLDRYSVFSTGIDLYGANKEIPPGYTVSIPTGIKTYTHVPFCFQLQVSQNLIENGLVLLNNSTTIGPLESSEINLQVANFTSNKVLLHYGQIYAKLFITTYIPVVQSVIVLPQKISILFIRSKAIFESWESLELNRKPL